MNWPFAFNLSSFFFNSICIIEEGTLLLFSFPHFNFHQNLFYLAVSSLLVLKPGSKILSIQRCDGHFICITLDHGIINITDVYLSLIWTNTYRILSVGPCLIAKHFASSQVSSLAWMRPRQPSPWQQQTPPARPSASRSCRWPT